MVGDLDVAVGRDHVDGAGLERFRSLTERTGSASRRPRISWRWLTRDGSRCWAMTMAREIVRQLREAGQRLDAAGRRRP